MNYTKISIILTYFTTAAGAFSQVGTATVANWRDNATAAATFTIDDNNAGDHAWWTATAASYNIPLTWFVITGEVDGSNPAHYGTWSGFSSLENQGHDVQSHTIDHLPNYPSSAPLGIPANYAGAITDIETNIPGSDVLTLAYPFGLAGPNDPTIAANHYIGARGVTGTPNTIGGVDYYDVNSISLSDNGYQYPGNNIGTPWADLGQLTDPASAYNEGWVSFHAHGLNTVRQQAITGTLDYLTGVPNEFWIGSFTEVSQYAQERDAAVVTTTLNLGSEVRLTLTDGLDDTRFYAPLTLQVEIDPSWAAVDATQNGNPLTVTTLAGSNDILINAIPDGGEIILLESVVIPEPSSMLLLLLSAGLLARRRR